MHWSFGLFLLTTLTALYVLDRRFDRAVKKVLRGLEGK